jgi:sulfofructose kinase
LARILCIGHAVQDYVFSLADLPSGGRKHRAHAFDSAGGGPAATAAAAIAKLGGAAALAARVGADPIGAAIVEELSAYGVDCRLVRAIPGARSSLSAVMVDDRGERMIVNYRDPHMSADAGWLADALDFQADAALADGKWPEGATVGLLAARACGAPAILDPDEPAPDAPALYEAATHIAFSAEGLRGLTGCRDLAEALASFHARRPAWCCVTDGPRGALICDGGRMTSIGSYHVHPVDTLGAGDVWHGAFALRLAEGSAEIEAVRFANATAALKVSRRGAREGAPARAEVEALMREGTPSEATIGC